MGQIDVIDSSEMDRGSIDDDDIYCTLYLHSDQFVSSP